MYIKSSDVTGRVGYPTPLKITINTIKNVQIKTIKLLGLPRGATVYAGDHLFSSYEENNTADITTWDISNMQIVYHDERESQFLLAVVAMWVPENGGPIDVASSRFKVSLKKDDPPRIAARTGSGDTAFAAEVQHLTAAGEKDAPLPLPAPPPAPAAAGLPTETARIVVPAPAAPPPEGGVAAVPDSTSSVRSAAETGRLVARAKALIELGDISGARLLLERAQARNAPDATFLLAQTWDPDMLRAWKVRGMRADPDLARSLYAKAAEQGQTSERVRAARRD